MRNNMLHEIYRILLIFFNIILLFSVYTQNKKVKQCCILNMSIILLFKGINMYTNKLDTNFISLLLIKIGIVSILFAELLLFF
jgi:hypothetical protein